MFSCRSRLEKRARPFPIRMNTSGPSDQSFGIIARFRRSDVPCEPGLASTLTVGPRDVWTQHTVRRHQILKNGLVGPVDRRRMLRGEAT